MKKNKNTNKVILDMSMSLDGFIAGLHDGPDNPLGDNGMRVHKWIWGDRTDGIPGDGAIGVNREILVELKNTTGAIVVGRKTYNIVNGWGGTHPFGAVPAFVLSKNVPQNIPEGLTKFTFVKDGIASAIRQAKTSAGEKNVYVVGGANVAQQCINVGLLDEMHIHIAHLFLGDGVPLFHKIDSKTGMKQTSVIDGSGVTHLTFHFGFVNNIPAQLQPEGSLESLLDN
jgi:dihydrofolate reductase